MFIFSILPLSIAILFIFYVKELKISKYNNLTLMTSFIHNSLNFLEKYEIEEKFEETKNEDEYKKEMKDMYIKNFLNNMDLFCYSIKKGYVNKEDAFFNLKKEILYVLKNEKFISYLSNEDYEYINYIKETLEKRKLI